MDKAVLNASQRAAVETIEGPLLVLAGAGSGKTRVITHRAAHLLELGVPPERIVAVTFTNKAAGEMRERLAAMVGHATAQELAMSTFHSLGARMLREDPEAFGLEGKRFAILDQGDVYGLVRGLLREHGHHGAADRRFDVPGIAQRISLWKNDFVKAGRVEREVVDEYDAAAASIYAAYEDRLRSLGAVDFDDLVCTIAHRLRVDATLRDTWQAKFDYFMVDEYQDTNAAQFQFLRQLVPEPYNLCVVGDDDQAIYGWRGAKVDNILGFDRVFKGAKVVKLEHNYRSRAPILGCANEVVRNNKTRRDKKLRVTRRGGRPVQLVVAADSGQETQFVGKSARRLVVEERVGASEVAVLYRSAIQAKSIEEELQTHGLRYRVLGGQSMYDKREVRDAMAYLKTIVTPRDELAVRRALETPARGIGRQTMSRLLANARQRGDSLLAAVHRADEIAEVPKRAAAALGRFSKLVRQAQTTAKRKKNASLALAELLAAVEFRDHVRRETGSDQATDARMRDVEWLVTSVGRFERRTRDRGRAPRWGEYFGSVSLDGTDDESPDARSDGEITLATLHSAKGLEWDYVFMIGLEEGTMPHRRVTSPRANDPIPGDLEEERRLFYVGITRAREQLFLTRAAARIDRGREIPREPSRFLEELPAKGVQLYDIANEEELTSNDIGSMADAFLARVKPEDSVDASGSGSGSGSGSESPAH